MLSVSCLFPQLRMLEHAAFWRPMATNGCKLNSLAGFWTFRFLVAVIRNRRHDRPWSHFATRLRNYFRNNRSTGAPVVTTSPDGVNAPVFGSALKTVMLFES